MFGNKITAEIIARIFQRADEVARNEIVNGAVNDIKERDRVSVLCREIRRNINKNPFIRSLSISAEAVDNKKGDALFVFRYKNEVKIGLVEAKILKINNANLDAYFDWIPNKHNYSHFTHQLKNLQKWVNEMAVWNMFIPNCPNGQYSPPLIAKGSSNIWSSDLINHPKVSTPLVRWNFNDALNPPVQYMNLHTVIKSILNCKNGKVHIVSQGGRVEVKALDDEIIDIPVPHFLGSIWGDLKQFSRKYYNINSYNYYRFDDLVEVVDDFKEKRVLLKDPFIKREHFDEDEYIFFKQILNEIIK